MANTKFQLATLTLAIAAATALPSGLRAQSTPPRKAASFAARGISDSTTDDSDATQSWQLRTGASAGSLRYQGGRTESAAALLVKLGLGEEVSFGITPTFAHVTYPGSSGSGSGNVSGLTDIPAVLALQHSFGGRFDPSLGFSAAATIPVGDTAKGLGSGSIGSSFDVSGGFSPTSGFGVSAGVGHSFSDFSVRSALNGTAAGWADVGAWGDVTDRLSVSAGYDRDIGAVDSAYGRSSSISAGMSYDLFRETNVAISAARGVAGPSPLWSVSLGFGTAIPSVGGGFHNAINQLSTAFGGGNHGLSKKGTAGKNGSGTGSTATGRGRGRRRIGT